MRWRFIRQNSPESEARQRVLSGIKQWWTTFQQKLDDLDALFSQKKNWDLVTWMQQTLQQIDPRLCWEFGPAINKDGHRLVITPETHAELYFLTRSIVAAAPDLPGWEFYTYRVAEDMESLAPTVEGRTGQSIEDVLVKPSIASNNQISLEFVSPHAKSETDEGPFHAVFVAAEMLLGEKCLERWIGPVEMKPANRSTPAGAIPLNRLKPTVDALISSIQDQLPSSPWHSVINEETEWSAFEINPVETPAPPQQTDLFAAVTALPDVKVASMQPHFYSQRFSKCNETFCYIKIDTSSVADQDKATFRQVIEENLDQQLVEAGVGCLYGGGTGLRYSYCDAALSDVNSALKIIARFLHQQKLPKKTWIQFFDKHLAHEWIGLYPDSPPPPMPIVDD